MVWGDDLVTRRQALVHGGRSTLGVFLAGSIALGRRSTTAEPSPNQPVQAFARYTDLLDPLRRRGRKWRTLGHASDASPIVAMKCGGEKQPAILSTAGAHATEHAGVVLLCGTGRATGGG